MEDKKQKNEKKELIKILEKYKDIGKEIINFYEENNITGFCVVEITKKIPLLISIPNIDQEELMEKLIGIVELLKK